jgi:hypothetical protein
MRHVQAAIAICAYIVHINFKERTMQTFVYKQTQTHYLHVFAETQERAKEIADETEVYADTVYATELNGWELTQEEA